MKDLGMMREELREHLLDAIAACWMNRRDKDGFVFDSFQDLLHALGSHAGFALIVTKWSDDKLWNLLRARFDAVEYPWGVLNFAKDQLATAKQRRDHLSREFPTMVRLIEKTLPSLD